MLSEAVEEVWPTEGFGAVQTRQYWRYSIYFMNCGSSRSLFCARSASRGGGGGGAAREAACQEKEKPRAAVGSGEEKRQREPRERRPPWKGCRGRQRMELNSSGGEESRE